jgi:hypothetical protein
MTTYSKVCPKCQTNNDLAATTCKRCKLKFGTPVEAAKPKTSAPEVNSRVGIVLGVVGLMLLILGFQVFGAIQERARRQKEIQQNSWDSYVKKRDGGDAR